MVYGADVPPTPRRYGLRHCLFGVCLALRLAAAPWSASAQQLDGFRLGHGVPGPGTSDTLTGTLPGSPGSLGWSAQLWTEYARSPLLGTDVDGRQVDIVRDQLQLRMSGAFGVHDRVRLLIDAPLTLVQTGDATRFEPPRSFGMGDTSLGIAWFAYGEHEHGAQLGVTVTAVLPTGSTRALAGDGGLGARAETQLAYQTERLRAFTAAGINVRPTRHYGDLDIGSEFQFRGGVVVPAGTRLSFLVEATALTTLRRAFASGNTAIEMFAGARTRLGPHFHLTAAIGAGLTQAPATPALHALFAIGWNMPTNAAVEPAEDAPARPAGTTSDADRDGIVDADDACPAIPEDLDGFDDADGCPDNDNDGDGLPDERDECPSDPETFNDFNDQDGCPDWEPVGIQTGPLTQIAPIVATARGTVNRENRALVDAVIKLLNDNPEITKLSVEGHASREPNREKAQQTSQRAAEQVVRLLVRGGVDASRLAAVGLGNDDGVTATTALPKVWVGFHVAEINQTQAR